MKIILFTVVFIIEVYLSHQNGKESGAESRALSERLYAAVLNLRKIYSSNA